MAKDPFKKQPSLTDFINDNSNLLTAIGIFVALTIFATDFPIKRVGGLLSFVFLSMTLLLFLELWARQPQGTLFPGSRIELFVVLLIAAVFALTFAWLLEFRLLLHPFMGPLFVILLIGAFLSLLGKTTAGHRVIQATVLRIPEQQRALRTLAISVLLFLIVYAAGWIGLHAAGPFNSWLDRVAADIAKTPPGSTK